MEDGKDNYVTLAAEDQTNPSIARPSQTDYTIVVWEDQRDDGETGKDIYAQKIDNVNGLPQWTPVDGVPVCTASYNQTNPRAAYDSLGHVIIVWEDARGESSTSSVFAQCLDVSDGSANWQTNGIAVCDTSADALQPRIVGVAEGAYIAWVDSRNKLDVADSTNRDIYLQYLYSQSGNWPTGSGVTWRSCGILVSGDTTGLHDDCTVELARDAWWKTAVDTKDKDGVVLVYESRRDMSGTGGADSIYFVYADSYDADGNWRWQSQDIRCAANDEEQLNPRVVVLGNLHGVGDSVAVIVWQDAREDPTDIQYDIYGQVIEKHTGNIIGTVTGNAVCTADYTQRYPELSLYEIEEQGGQSYGARVICVWEDLRNTGSTGIDIYCAVMDAVTMNIATGTGTDGEEVCRNANDQRYPMVDNFPGNQDAYIVWQHDYTDYFSDVWYQSIDLGDLQFYWTQPVGLAVTEAKDSQVKPQVGGDVFVYADRRRNPISYDNRNDWNVYAETPGECVGDKYMDWRDMFAEVTTTGDAGHMRFVVDAEFNSLVVWEEPGERAGEQNVYIQKLDADGVPRWENSGIKLNTNRFASLPEVTISDSTGGAQVVWQQYDGSTDSVWYAKLSPMGAISYQTKVGPGKAPVIDYTDKVWDNSSGAYYTPTYQAYIALVDPARTVTLYQWPLSGNSWISRTISTPPSWYPSAPQGVIIRSSLGGGIYGAIYSTTSTPVYITPFAGNHIFTLGSQGTNTGGSLQGLDIERDDFGTGAYGGKKDGCLVYCLSPIGSANTNLYSVWLDPIGNGTSYPWTLSTANQLQNEYYRHPALCADNSLNVAWGGMLLAWDKETKPGATAVHDVYSDQLWFNGTNWVFATNSAIRVNPNSTTYALYPDIARIDRTSSDTAAFVVWEDMLEICSPSRPKEIVGNWVLYDTTSSSRGPIWSNPKMVGPGAGNYSQLRPMVRPSKDSTVNVFWYDGRGSSVLVVGTRLWAVDTTLAWAKEVVDEPVAPDASIHLGANYPNPLSLTRTRISHVVLEMTVESAVELTLYDNLGRIVGIVYDGVLTEGRHDLRFDVTSLSPGMYHYVLRSENTIASRGLILVR